MFALMMIPFAFDALIGLVFVYGNAKKSSSDYVCAEFVGETQERKVFPEAIQVQVDRLMETEFYQQFCSQNWKKNAFNMTNALATQMMSGLLTFALIYTSIISAVESPIAPVLSLFVTFYALMSLYNYFGLNDHAFIDASASYFAAAKLGLITLGYTADSLIMTGAVDFSFLLMTVILCFDAFQGVAVYLSQAQYISEKKIFNKKSSLSATFCMDNWKSNLFRAHEVALKTAAIVALTLQVTAAVSAVVSITSILSVVVLAYTMVGVVVFCQTTSSDFLQAFHSYVSCIFSNFYNRWHPLLFQL